MSTKSLHRSLLGAYARVFASAAVGQIITPATALPNTEPTTRISAAEAELVVAPPVTEALPVVATEITSKDTATADISTMEGTTTITTTAASTSITAISAIAEAVGEEEPHRDLRVAEDGNRTTTLLMPHGVRPSRQSTLLGAQPTDTSRVSL
jgi:hypothetical protein